MTFYRCDVKIANFRFQDEFEKRMIKINELNQKISKLNALSKGNDQLFLHYAESNEAAFDIAFLQNNEQLENERMHIGNIVNGLLLLLGIKSSSVLIMEITEAMLTERLRKCLGVKYIHDEDLIKHLGGKAYLSGMAESPIKDDADEQSETEQADAEQSDTEAVETEWAFPEEDEIQEESPESETDAYTELSNLIGLSGAKEVIKRALDFFTVQKMFQEKGIRLKRPSMHMMFTGNPGTAKTTVARLFARIMKYNGLLENGELTEVGRADLVGRFIGHTAPQVKEVFERARGGVLFIDEAYSLVDDRNGSFADEAINTIVQEMENVRDDTVVIFAGYPDQMEKLLEKNPGLRSRISYHVPFSNYDTNELFAITELLTKENDMTLADGVKEKLSPIFDAFKNLPDFGNGRFVRNLFEQAIQKQASRLIQGDISKMATCEFATLTADDFDKPADVNRKMRIGFCQE